MTDDNIYLIYSDFDYSPVAVYTEDKGIIFRDNIHNQGYWEFAEGYGMASGRPVELVYIDDMSDIEEHAELMKVMCTMSSWSICNGGEPIKQIL